MENEELQEKELTQEEIELADQYYEEAKDLFFKDKYKEALEWIDKSLKIDNTKTVCYILKGQSLLFLEDYVEARESLETSVDILNKELLDLSNSYRNKRIDKKTYHSQKYWITKFSKKLETSLIIAHFKLKENEKAIEHLIKAELSLLDILSTYTIFKPIIPDFLDKGGDTFFDKTIQKDNKHKKEYQSIYVKSLEIVASLYIAREDEKQVAHYTYKDVSEKMFAESSPFRLSTVATANDPKEGKPLLKYFEIEDTCISDDFQAFVGCFIFNPDSLNQFRLYGKENGEEGTGVSIVFKKEYFSKEIGINTTLFKINQPLAKEEIELVDDKQEDKLGLFRCIYLDPNTEQIISVGHKEEYTFYRERYPGKNKIYKKTINEYKKYKKEIENLVDDLRGNLNDLKGEIDELLNKAKNNNERLEMQKCVCDLLIHLRYLVKHVAFKEEQECRLIRVERLDHEDVKYKDNRMFINYLPIRSYASDVYFGPKAKGISLYKDMLRHKGIAGIECHQSDHPFF